MTLADLPPGGRAVVLGVEGDELACVHLMEAGFTPGQPVRLLARSPLGCPVAVAVRGAVIALRREEAACIQV